MLQDLEVCVELVDEGYGGGDIEFSDVCIMGKLPVSDTLLSTFTMALRLFPCATTSTRFSDLIVGTITLFQYGKTRSMVILRLCIVRKLPLSWGIARE